MQNKFDCLFKIAVLGFLAAFFTVYLMQKDVGRYAMVKDFVVLDTTTGEFYVPMYGKEDYLSNIDKSGWYKFNPE